jgi:hypothetical protein
MKKPIGLILFMAICLTACHKSVISDAPQGTFKNYPSGASVSYSPGGAFSFTKLEASPATIVKGNLSKVVATATGSNLTFTWSTPHGDIFGTGPAVYYGDSCVGSYDVTCVVSDGSQSKTITITITITD